FVKFEMTKEARNIFEEWHYDADEILSPTYSSLLQWCEIEKIGQHIRLGYEMFCEVRGLSLLKECESPYLLELTRYIDHTRVREVLSAPRIAWRFLQNGFSFAFDSPHIAESLIVEA